MLKGMRILTGALLLFSAGVAVAQEGQAVVICTDVPVGGGPTPTPVFIQVDNFEDFLVRIRQLGGVQPPPPGEISVLADRLGKLLQEGNLFDSTTRLGLLKSANGSVTIIPNVDQMVLDNGWKQDAQLSIGKYQVFLNEGQSAMDLLGEPQRLEVFDATNLMNGQ